MRKKILLVEDDAELVELLSFNLKRAGFSVSTAGDGIAALKKARSLNPDLILLDVLLPELDGFMTCEILRRDPATNAIPIVIVTAISSQMARLTGLELGANDFITKPFSTKALLARVEALLGNSTDAKPASPNPNSKPSAFPMATPLQPHSKAADWPERHSASD